jgi:transposase
LRQILSIDGSIVKASASRKSAVMKNVLEVIEEYVKNELKKGIEIDKVEDEHFGKCRGYDQLNESEKYKVKAVVVKYIKQVNKDESGDRKRDFDIFLSLFILKRRIFIQFTSPFLLWVPAYCDSLIT